MIPFVWFFFCFCFLLHCTACGILVPQPGMEPTPPALEGQSLNYWTTGEVIPAKIKKIATESKSVIAWG